MIASPSCDQGTGGVCQVSGRLLLAGGAVMRTPSTDRCSSWAVARPSSTVLAASRTTSGYGSPREPRLGPSRGRASVTVSLGRVAELADAEDSGSCVRKDVGVQVPPRPPALTWPVAGWLPARSSTSTCRYNHFATRSAAHTLALPWEAGSALQLRARGCADIGRSAVGPDPHRPVAPGWSGVRYRRQ